MSVRQTTAATTPSRERLPKGQRQKAQNCPMRLSRLAETAFRRPQPRKSAQIRGLWCRVRDFGDGEKCVVADAVVVELVSAAQFPANREKNRDFRNSLLFLGPDAARVPMIWGHESRIPYSLEQGFFQKDQGISGSYQGNSVELVERRASIYHASFCLPNVGSQSIPRGRLCANRC